MEHELPPLPYAKEALEPHISRETLEFHHGKHHATYVKKLNELLPGSGFENASLEDISRRATGPLFNNGAQAWNHDFYWKCLSPNGGDPSPELGKELARSFESVAGFKTAFSKAAETAFGSAWVWLVRKKDGRLDILTTGNADNPLRSGDVPLLTCDVWEHAYYIDRRNARPEYVKAFWNVVNWDFVARNCALPASTALA
jgi:Fe-Mn family superoxide dismutase